MIKTGLSRLGIFFLYLVSLLPFWILYLFADLIFVILYYITWYRRKVVQENLLNSFPEKTADELKDIEKKYFRYLADLLVETIKCTTISADEIIARVVCTNPDLVDSYLTSGRNIVTVAGHYCNWEMAGLNFTAVSDKKFLMVYKPLSNKVFDDYFIKVRSQFGGIPVPMKQSARKMVELRNEATVTVLVGDQTPVKHEATYFTSFMNQPTAVFLGVEKMAKLTDAVVVFYDMKRIKRGYYTYTVVPLTENAKASAPNEITEAHVQYLESMIRREPQYWLWSHRRWKFKPDDVH
jgi:KDO2-lipid IV(A) lauroyltransferase